MQEFIRKGGFVFAFMAAIAAAVCNTVFPIIKGEWPYAVMNLILVALATPTMINWWKKTRY